MASPNSGAERADICGYKGSRALHSSGIRRMRTIVDRRGLRRRSDVGDVLAEAVEPDRIGGRRTTGSSASIFSTTRHAGTGSDFHMGIRTSVAEPRNEIENATDESA